MAKSKKDLLEEAKELGIELSGEESNADIQEAIDIKKEEAGDDNENDKKEIKGGYFYHVKVKAYRDGENRVDIGLYHSKKKIERFDKIADEYVERFDGEIPSLELHKIAEKFKVSAYEKGGKKARKDGELLEELVKEL
jgi:hypothetical protein